MTCYIRLRAAAVAPDCGCFQSAMHGCSCLLPPSLRVAVPNPPTAPAPLELQECNSPIFVEHLPAWPNLQILLLRTVRPTAIGAQQLALLAAAPACGGWLSIVGSDILPIQMNRRQQGAQIFRGWRCAGRRHEQQCVAILAMYRNMRFVAAPLPQCIRCRSCRWRCPSVLWIRTVRSTESIVGARACNTSAMVVRSAGQPGAEAQWQERQSRFAVLQQSVL